MGEGKSVVKSVRMEKSLSNSLEKLARSKNMTYNGLVSAALSRYVEWDSQTERYGFGAIPVELFRELLETDSSKEIEQVGKMLGPRLLKDLLQFWFKRVTPNAFIQYLELVSKYAGLTTCDVDYEGDFVTVTYRHQLGRRWSRFISAYYTSALEELFGANPKSEISDYQVVIDWKKQGSHSTLVTPLARTSSASSSGTMRS